MCQTIFSNKQTMLSLPVAVLALPCLGVANSSVSHFSKDNSECSWEVSLHSGQVPSSCSIIVLHGD